MEIVFYIVLVPLIFAVIAFIAYRIVILIRNKYIPALKKNTHEPDSVHVRVIGSELNSILTPPKYVLYFLTDDSRSIRLEVSYDVYIIMCRKVQKGDGKSIWMLPATGNLTYYNNELISFEPDSEFRDASEAS